jgi:superfamily II DNA or RNA helicase
MSSRAGGKIGDPESHPGLDTWDPSVPGVEVRLHDNPGLRGITTGETRLIGTRLHAEIRFGPNDVKFKPVYLLEVCPKTPEAPLTALKNGRFGTLADMRQLLTLEKVRGRLTNVFYSMESSNTDFYAYQFRSVLKFLESPTGRLLIADEVGLGKTIEAIYVWKELEARAAAQRLLIVCPAILQEKWQNDLLNHFNIKAHIKNAEELRADVASFLASGSPSSFQYICSLEGLRPGKKWEQEDNDSPRAQVARLFDRNQVTSEAGLFDLVIIDEAHYLRNADTASNRLGRLLRDSAQHLLLLTATPIQIHSENLFQLLRMISPEYFLSVDTFDSLMRANKPVVSALRNLWANPPDLEQASSDVESALTAQYFRSNLVLQRVGEALAKAERLDADGRVRLGQKLESCSLIGQYLTRTRKRDVIENRVERDPKVLDISFSESEKEIYERVTKVIRKRARESEGIQVFREIARQRQMASCLVAALQSWEDTGSINELLWDDMGIAADLADSEPSGESGSSEGPSEQASELPVANIDYRMLEANDGKYKALLTFLSNNLQPKPKEKFVLFAFFRGTLQYLHRRLRQDGISSVLLLGGMGEEKWDVIREFADPNGPSVLLSSEVGSEGIDLQFAQFIINYDLPWNPMRVEQRIGRLDRIGQKSPKIFILNFCLKDSIEDRILKRLYERIRIFQESLGDLEEILGDRTDRLMLDVFLKDLSEEELQRQVDQVAHAIAVNHADQDRLESEAINMVAFSDYLIDTISKSREGGRWLQPAELRDFVEDFFHAHYPGTSIRRKQPNEEVYLVSLSDQARSNLGAFLSTYTGPRTTRLHRSSVDVPCFFDPKQSGVMARNLELMDQTHPLIQWIKTRYEHADERPYPVSAIVLPASLSERRPGCHVFVIQLWELSGIRRETRVAYKAARVEGSEMISDEDSERFVAQALMNGRDFPNASNLIDMELANALARGCEDFLCEAYDRTYRDFEEENANRCAVQEQSARDYTNRRVRELELRIRSFQIDGNEKMVPPTQGLINKAMEELNSKLKQIQERRIVDTSFKTIAAGVIQIE